MKSFNVYAGSMYCGELVITSSGCHLFRNRDGKRGTPEKVSSYRGLYLERTDNVNI